MHQPTTTESIQVELTHRPGDTPTDPTQIGIIQWTQTDPPGILSLTPTGDLLAQFPGDYRDHWELRITNANLWKTLAATHTHHTTPRAPHNPSSHDNPHA